MKRATFTALFLTAFFFTAFCQQQPDAPETAVFRIDYFRPDSLYLVEVRSKVAQPGVRPETREIPMLVKDTAQVAGIILQIQKKSEALQKEADDLNRIRIEVDKVYQKLKARLNNQN